MPASWNVAVVGATGAVGNEMLSILEERDFPVKSLRLFASERSAGAALTFRGKEYKVKVLSADGFEGIDLALFSAGGARSREFVPPAVEAGAVVVDNTSAFRMVPEIPLVVPEVNPEALDSHKGIIANPNCSTIQMVVVLKPIHDAVGIRRVVVSTYQSVSGTGKRAMAELEQQVRDLLNFREPEVAVYPHEIAFNCLPHIGGFNEDGYCEEEVKMVNETRKIMGLPNLAVTATTVRVPVFHCHSESVNVETERHITANEARAALSVAQGVIVYDSPRHNLYPLAREIAGKDEVYVGRIREDKSVKNGLDLWIVGDNLRKGAALNSIQIAELLIEKDLLRVPSRQKALS
ncbi:MAG: aspartate-semialdehyde dehydrogenase [Candidatus Tectomicrobia bacterium]|nr:aspartate-semialdehyde dehydrogenase [Candidatus Tectomicrobia bacterium]